MSKSISKGKKLQTFLMILSLMAFIGLIGCDSPTLQVDSASPQLASSLVYYDWEDFMPQSILDDFNREFGVEVKYVTYTSPSEAYANLRAGEVYDVMVVENREVPALAREALLAELHHANIDNFKNIAANFRDLMYDPGNRYSIPQTWGTIGLLVRDDLVVEPVTRWMDLWDSRYAGRVGFWLDMPREVISIALKSLGYSANSEDPVQLEAALEHLLKLKPHMLRLEDFDPMYPFEVIESGQAVMVMSWNSEALERRELDVPTSYVLPEEGTLLWGENLVIPAKTTNQYTAEVFINFLLRPDINARMTNKIKYATPNEAAKALVDPSIVNDPLIFPTNEDLFNGELIFPLSPEGRKLYDDIWKRFIEAESEE